jgi:hypothetical protein
MPDIEKLKGISQIESKTLRDCGINSVEDLWVRISEEHDNGLSKLANQSGLQKDRLIDLLASEGMRQPGRFGSAWFKHHWLDILIVAIALVLTVFVWRKL